MDLLEVVDRDHAGKVRIEIDLARSKVRIENTRLVKFELWIRLLVGQPQLVGYELVYPVELPGMGTYDRRRDGDMSNEQIGKFALQRALDLAWRGASALLDAKPTTPLELRGMHLADSGRLTDILTHLS